jgi:aerobic carbon-monoxide dehydrogenase medium subunit
VIPGSFAYHRPKSVAEATGLLAQYADNARILAGGQSLIPMMKLRLAAPDHLIDLAALAELKGIARKADTLSVGAMTTQHELITSQLITETVPIIRETSLLVADPQVRYVGTLGGNLANGDPGNDMPAIMLCLDATYRVLGRDGARAVRARDFYQGTYATALGEHEILTAVEIPIPPGGHGFAYEKLKRKIGDYATAAAGVLLTAKGGKITSCAIGLTNLGDTPLYAESAAAAVLGSSLEPAALGAARAAARAIMAPAVDARGSIEYRTYVGGVMVERALKRAWARATN